MSEYMSDKEQILLFKKWWKEYGVPVVLSVCVFLAITYGWRYWQGIKFRQAETASMIYSEMLTYQDLNKPDEVEALVGSLTRDYKGTIYASLAALTLAESAIQNGQFNIAEEKLQWVIDHGNKKDIRALARVRLARIYILDKKYDQALATLDGDQDAAFDAYSLEVRGDALLAQGKKDEAKAVYQKAQAENLANNVTAPILEMKLQNLN